MSQGSSVASGLVRVTVASGSRRVDLVLPGSIPVAELVPELARSVGLLDASTVYGGYRLVTQEGRILVNNAGLTMQGIEDGGLLTVTAGVDDKAPRVYDDVVEAMADVVENELQPWEPSAGRRTALGAGSILLGLGALALLLQGESLLGGVAAAVIAGLLVVGGIVLARAQEEPEAGVAVSLLAALYAGVAGLLLAPGELPGWDWPLDDAFFSDPLLFAGLGVLAVGLVAVVGLQDGRPLVIPAIVVGAVLVASSVLIRVASLEPERRVHRPADARRARGQHLPVAGARGDRHQGRPALLAARHHGRPRRDRPRRGRPTTPASATRSCWPSRRRSAPCWSCSRRSRWAAVSTARSSRRCAAWPSCSAPASTAPAPRSWPASSPGSSAWCRWRCRCC